MCACTESMKISSMTSKLSRMVGHVKRKRKAFSAQHSFLLDLFAAPPSSPVFTSPFPFFSSHTSPSKPSKIPHFASHTPLQTPTSLTPRIAPSNSSLLRVHDTPRSAPVSPQRSLHIGPHPKKKDLHTHPFPPLHSNPSPLSASVIPRRCQGKHSVHRTLWAVLWLALVCTFLCIGKEIAFVVAMVVHLILQLGLGIGLLAREANVNSAAQASFHHHEGFDNSVEKDNILCSNGHTHSLIHSSTVPRSGPFVVATSFQCNRRSKSWTKHDGTSLQWNRRSKSWSKLHGSVEWEMQPSKVGESVDSPSSSERATISSPQRGNLAARMKPQVVLLFALGGLCHGRLLAMCMALCCILIYSKMESLFSKRRL